MARFAKKMSPMVLAIVAALAIAAAAVYASDSITIPFTATQQITGPDATCKRVTNNSSTGLSEYVPTVSTAEWQSFIAHPPAGVTLATCVAACVPGSQTYQTPGTDTFTVPSYTGSLVVEVWGGGGGGGVVDCPGWQPGVQGGNSSFNSTVVARGGAPGSVGAGTGGTASGGDINTDGAAGSGSNGGTAPFGGAGGAGANFYGGVGSAPGGGGGAANFGNAVAGGAGSGAYARKTYSSGALTPGSDISVVVGPGGRGGIPVGCIGSTAHGGDGASGRVSISWSCL